MVKLTTKLVNQLGTRSKQMDVGGLGASAGNAVSGIGFGGGSWGEDHDHSYYRKWAESNVWIYSALQMREHAVADADWDIVVVDRQQPWDETTRGEMLERLDNPNPKGKNNSWGSFIQPVIDDVLVIDNGAFQKLDQVGGAPDALVTMDGSRLIERPGWKSEDDGDRYFYLNEDWSGRGIPFANDEVVNIIANPKSHRATGLAPLKVLQRIIKAEYQTFRSMAILQQYRTPAGLLVLPNTSPETVEKIKDLFLNELNGKSGIGFMDVPDTSKFIELASTNLEQQGAFAFYDMMVRAIASAFRTSTLALNWLQDVNRATAREQAQMVDDGLLALLKLVQSYLNQEVIKAWPKSDNLAFRFNILATRDEAQQAHTIRERMGPAVNWMSLNQACIADGMEVWRKKSEGGTIPDDAMPWVDEPLVPAGNGLQLPVSIAAEQYAALPMDAGIGLEPGLTGAAAQAETGTSQLVAGVAQAGLKPSNRGPYRVARRKADNPGDPMPPAGRPTTGADEIRQARAELQAEIDALFTARQHQGKEDSNGH